MIDVAAWDKLNNVIRNGLSSQSLQELKLVLEGKKFFSREQSWKTDFGNIIAWMEQRLATHGYLHPSQVNTLWGESTDEAIKKLQEVYKIQQNGLLGKDTLTALIDGQKGYTGREIMNSSYNWLMSLILDAGYTPPKNETLIVGLRGYMRDIGKVKNVPDIYNDTIFLMRMHKGREEVIPFKASCDPGRYYYAIKPLNNKGCATLTDGEWLYQRGKHGMQQYLALVQAQPVTVARSFNGFISPTDKLDTGWFGINHHAGTAGKHVYNASAGCQVIQDVGPSGAIYQRYIQELYKQPQKRFTYYLFSTFAGGTFNDYVKRFSTL